MACGSEPGAVRAEPRGTESGGTGRSGDRRSRPPAGRRPGGPGARQPEGQRGQRRRPAGLRVPAQAPAPGQAVLGDDRLRRGTARRRGHPDQPGHERIQGRGRTPRQEGEGRAGAERGQEGRVAEPFPQQGLDRGAGARTPGAGPAAGPSVAGRSGRGARGRRGRRRRPPPPTGAHPAG